MSDELKETFSEDFTEGLVVKFAEKTERIKPTNPSNADKDGLANLYILEIKNGEKMKYESGSKRLAYQILENHVQVGDYAKITCFKDVNGYNNFKVEKIDETFGAVKIDDPLVSKEIQDDLPF